MIHGTPRYQATLLPRPPNNPLPRPKPPDPEAGPPGPGPCSSIVRARLAIPSGGGDDFCCCNWGAPISPGPGPIPRPAPLPLLPAGGAPQDALTNTPTPRPVSDPPAVLEVAEVDVVSVIIASGALGGVSVCRRLGVAASPSTLGSSRKPNVNGLAFSAPELAHAEEPAAGGWGTPCREDVMRGGSGSMSGIPAAARPSGSMPRSARRCTFSDSRRAISCSRSSDQSKSRSSAVSERARGEGSRLPAGFAGVAVMVVGA